MAEAEVGLRASLKDRAQTARGLRDVEQGVDRVGRSAETAGRRARLGARGFDAMRNSGRHAATAIKVGFGAALAAGYGVTRLLRGAFDEAREAQKVGAITRATIKSMGREAAVSARHVERLSGRLSRMAGIDDEIIQGGANVLLRLQNVRNEVGRGNKIFDRATAAATNMAAALAASNGSEPDVAAASKVVGKALADPAKAATALRRSQIFLTESQQDSIKTMVEQGNTLGAQKFLLDELQKRFGGAAREQATWADKAEVSWGNLQERLGTALLPLADRGFRWFTREGVPEIEKGLDVFEDKGIPALQDFADAAQPLARKILPSVATALGDVRDVLSTAAPYAADLVGAFRGMPSWARKAIVGGALVGAVGSKTGATSAIKGLLGSKGGGGLLGAVSKTKPLPVYVVNNGVDLPGKTPKGTPSVGGSALKYGGVAGLTFGSIALGAEGIAKWLGGRPVGSDPSRAQQYADDLRNPNYGHAGVQFHTSDLFTGMQVPVTFNDDTSALIFKNGEAINRFTGEVLSANDATKLLNGQLDTTKQPVDPAFTTPGLPDSKRSATDYASILAGVRQPVNTSVHVDTPAAMAAVHSFASAAAAALNGFFGGSLGTPSTPTPTTPTQPKVKTPRNPRTTALSDHEKVAVPSLAGAIAVHSRIELDGRVVYDSLKTHAQRDLANQ